MFKEVLEDYIKAQDKYTRAKNELKEMETKLATECRRKISSWASTDSDAKIIATILLGKIND